VGFGSLLLIAKFLTPIELGQIKTMQSYVEVATIIAGFGFNTAVLKLCSEKRALEEKSYIFRKNSFYNVFFIMLTLLVLFLLSKFNLLSADPIINNWFIIYMLTIPALVYTSMIMVYFQALKEIQLMSKVQIYIRLFIFGFLIFITYFYGLIGFILSSVVTVYLALMPLIIILKKNLSDSIEVPYIFSRSFFLAKYSVASNAVNALAQNMDIIMLNYLINDRASLGYYGLATFFIFGLSQVTSTVQTISTPYFSEKSDDKREFLRVLKKYQKLLVTLSIFITMISIICIPSFIRYFYGYDYDSTARYFKILVFRYLFDSFCALLGVAVLGLGMMKYNFYSSLISVPISIALSYVFIHKYGVMGAAIAQALSYFITFIIVYFMAWHVFGIYFKKMEQ
jgi:O-antigen/teichoic acid export membrane protein